MKKVTFLLLAVFVAFCANAQKKMITSAQTALDKNDLKKAWQDIQAAANNEETKSNPKTYYVMGTILQEVARQSDSALKANPEVASISSNPTVDAYAAYQKSLSIDPKKFRTDIDLKLQDLVTLANIKAMQHYDAKAFDKSLEQFELMLEIEKAPIYKNFVDTSTIFNTGLTAMSAKNYDKAIEYLIKAVNYGYNGGSSYSWLRQAYMAKGDTVNANLTMQKAYEKYPNDLSVLVDLVNYYLTSGQVKEAFDYLNKAKEKDPNNVSFIFAEGTMYEKMNEPDKAFEAYNKAIEIDPTYFNAYYNLGVLFHNKARDLYEKANSENDNNKYNALLKQGDEELAKALPYLEKAHKLDPTEKSTAETLKTIYFRLSMTDKLNALKQEMGWQ